MADDDKPQAGTPEPDDTPDEPAAPPDKSDWKDAELEKARKDAAKRRVENKDLKAQLEAVAPKLEKIDALEQQIAQVTKLLEAAEASRKQSELNAARDHAAAIYGLPPELAKRLAGDTPEAIEKDAEELAKALPKPPGSRFSPGNSGESVSGAKAVDQLLERMRGRKTGPSEASQPSVHRMKGGGVVGIDEE